MIGITEPVDTRIGQRLYPAGTTAEMLLATTARTGERVEAAAAAGRPDLAARHAAEGAAAALDATAPERRAMPLRAEALWTPDKPGDPPPARGRTVTGHEPWQWRATVAGATEEHVDANGQCYAARFTVELHESPQSPVPPPRNVSWGFWGSWRSPGDEALGKTAAWTAVFDEYGAGGAASETNLVLRSVLDSAAGRKYADQVRLELADNQQTLRQAIHTAGDPRALWAQLNAREPSRPDAVAGDSPAGARPSNREHRLGRALIHVEQALRRDEAADPTDGNVQIRLLANGIQIRPANTAAASGAAQRPARLLIDESDSGDPIRLAFDQPPDPDEPAGSESASATDTGRTPEAELIRRLRDGTRRLAGSARRLPEAAGTSPREMRSRIGRLSAACSALKNAARDTETEPATARRRVCEQLHAHNARLMVVYGPESRTQAVLGATLVLQPATEPAWHARYGRIWTTAIERNGAAFRTKTPESPESGHRLGADADGTLTLAVADDSGRPELRARLQKALAAVTRHPLWERPAAD